MSQTEHLKCACKECGNNIEFPVSAARTTVTCPHCGQWTELLAAGEDSADEPGGRMSLLAVVGCVVLLVAGIVAGILVWQHHKQAVADDKTGATPPVKVAAKPAVKPPPTNASTQVATQAVAQVVVPKVPRPKSPDDLKVVGAVQLEKTKGSGLVYAVGSVKNDSEYDRYGLRIELDLLNLKRGKIGTAQDYKDFLGPHQEWQFRAMILEPKTVEAKVAALKEDQ